MRHGKASRPPALSSISSPGVVMQPRLSTRSKSGSRSSIACIKSTKRARRRRLEALAETYRAADGFVIVSGEYNNGIPPALKNLLDHFLEEYFWRPSAIVSYSAGRFGGVRAAVTLRTVLAEMGMSSVPSVLSIPSIQSALTEDGKANEAVRRALADALNRTRPRDAASAASMNSRSVRASPSEGAGEAT